MIVPGSRLGKRTDNSTKDLAGPPKVGRLIPRDQLRPETDGRRELYGLHGDFSRAEGETLTVLLKRHKSGKEFLYQTNSIC